nr:exopolysaccharide biosynthesis polyprenyl glycosylphosphotransferase [Brevibacterium sp.]
MTAVALQSIVTALAVSIVYLLTLGPAAVWILVCCMLDLLIATTAPGRSTWSVRVPLLSALVVTGLVAFIAVFTAADAVVPAVTIADENRYIFLVGLWGTAFATALIRAAVPAVLPKHRLRVVAEASVRPERAVSEAVIDPQSQTDDEFFVATVLAEVRRNDIDLVELTFGVDAETLRQLSWALRDRDVELYFPIVNLGFDPDRVRIRSAIDSSGLVIGPSRPRLLERLTKRFFDVALGAGLVVVFAPLLAAVAIAIKISMPGPAFYTQTRIGLDGKPFQIIKFRSMVVDADAQLKELLKTQGTGSQPLFKVQSDPRVTRLGHVLRRSSIDELPQLFNVVGGSMSLVGPRPQRDEEVALYHSTDHHRLGVRPGMTGLWQVSGRSDLEWDEAREFDLYYAHNWSLKNDLKILLRTFAAVGRAAGAR